MKWVGILTLFCFVALSTQYYEIFDFGTYGLSYNDWRQLAYEQYNGVSCGHAATWEDEKGWWDILNLIIDTYGNFGKRDPKYENVQFESLTPEEREEYYEHVLNLMIEESKKRDPLLGSFFFSTFFGAVKDPSSTTFYWDVGRLRGQPFFQIDNNVFGTGYIPYWDLYNYFFFDKRDVNAEEKERLIPLASHLSKKRLPTQYISYEDWDVQFESGFNCLQSYCFPRSFIGYFAYTEFSRGLFFSILNQVSYSSNENFAFGEMDSIGVDLPLDYWEYYYIDYGFVASTQSIIEYENIPTFANYHGGSKYQLMTGAFNWIAANDAANEAGMYLARIPSPEQYQWILDELQCATFNMWLGYKVDTVTGDILKGPGPSEGKPVYTEEFGYIPGEFNDKRTLPGIAPTQALSLRSVSGVGSWSRQAVGTAQLVLVQAEECSFNAKAFFGIDFQTEQRREKMCYPNPSSDWSAEPTERYDGINGYVQGNAFHAGQSVTFTNPFNEKSATMYFDCQCRTNPILDLACLGSDNWPGCQLYTNAQEYYDAGLYEQRLGNPGLAESYRRMEAYYYWIYLLNAV